MIEAICDRCGRRIELKWYAAGFCMPEVWQIETQSDPLTRELHYKTFCFSCRKDLLKKVDE